MHVLVSKEHVAVLEVVLTGLYIIQSPDRCVNKGRDQSEYTRLQKSDVNLEEFEVFRK